MAEQSFDEGFTLLGKNMTELQRFNNQSQQNKGVYPGREGPQSLKDESIENYAWLPAEENVQRLNKQIEEYEKMWQSLQHEIDDLDKEKQEYDILTARCQSKMDNLRSKISGNEQALTQEKNLFMERSRLLQDEFLELSENVKDIKDKIDDYEERTCELEKVSLQGVERRMVFKGNIANSSSGLSVKHQITYPLNGGSALITFNDLSVAAKVISEKFHTVNIDNHRIYVTAEPVELHVLDTLCMDMSWSPTKVLVHNLPQNFSEEKILDKLDNFFSKSKNGGGEVDNTEFLSDCRCAIITFLDPSVASRVVERKTFKVPFGGSHQHQVSVAPSLDGNLESYKMKRIECNRTVLLTGIPNISEKDSLQDLLELHFHKVSYDGIQALVYCPEGETAMAFFENDEDGIAETQ